MRAQLQKLLEESHRPNVTIQVLALTGDHVSNVHGPFYLLEIGQPAFFNIVLIEYLTGRLMLALSQARFRNLLGGLRNSKFDGFSGLD